MLPKLPDKRFPAILILSALGFVANWYKLELFFNVDFIFGSIFVLLASARFGVLSGIATGIIAGSCTWLLWQHPWALVIGITEVVVVGLILRRRAISLLAADTLYWLCFGAPLVWLLYHHVMDIPAQSSLLIVLKQSLNGICNAVTAQLILLVIRAHRAEPGQLPRFRQILSTVMVSLVLFTGMAALVTDLRDVMKRQLHELINNVEHTSIIAAKFISATRQKQQGTAEDLDLIRIFLKALAGQHAMQITIVNRQGQVIVSTNRDQATMSQPEFRNEESRRVGVNVIQWIPQMPPGNSIMQRWKSSRFVAEQHLGDDLPWKIVVEASPNVLLNTLASESILDMSLLLSIFLLSSLVVAMMNRMFLKPLYDLQKITGEISNMIPANQNISWPASRLFELDDLGANFRKMVTRLNDVFSQQENTFRQLALETEKQQQLKLQMLQIRDQVERDERGRISRDLHDSLGQSLQAVKLNLQIMKTRCNNNCDYDGYIIDDAISEIGATSEELRDIVAMLKPPVLEEQNLSEALGWMAERLSKRSGVNIRILSSSEPDLLGEELKSGLFRICQEALTNALRHGEPTDIEINISSIDNSLTLTVSDNGSGFDPYSCFPGSGIAIMKERTALLGGTFKLKSYNGKGTGIVIEVALP